MPSNGDCLPTFLSIETQLKRVFRQVARTRRVPRQRFFFRTGGIALLVTLLWVVPALGSEKEAQPPALDALFLQIEERFPYLRFRGHLGYTLGADTQWENDREDRLEGWGTAFFETRLDLTDDLLTVASARFHHSVRVNGRTDTLYEADLHECYVDVLMEPFQLRVGKQIVPWGKADVLSPLDVLNPMDFRYILDPTPESVKVPVLMVRGNYYGKNWSIEGVYIPFFQEMQFDVFGSDFSLLKHRLPELRFGGFLGVLENLGWIRFPPLPSPDTLDPEFLRRLEDALLATDYPDDDFLHGEYGLALRGTWRSVDAELVYFYGWDDIPVYEIHPSLARALNSGTLDAATLAELFRRLQAGDLNGIVHSSFHRMHVVGGGVSAAWKDFTFRADTAWFQRRVFYDETLHPFFAPSLFTVLGIDYTRSERCILHLEFFDHSFLTSTQRVVGLDPDTYGLIFYYTGAFFDLAFTPEMRMVFFLNNQDLFINPRVSYAVTSHLSVVLGAAFFEGSGPVEVQTFVDLARITPISFFSENDWIYGKVQYAF